MPHFMEMDKNTRKRYENEQMKKQEHEGEKK